jgi:hypothetical protein
MGGLCISEGGGKFMPPKQALVSPWLAWYLTPWGGNENPFVSIKTFPSCRHPSAEAGEALLGHASPAEFWRHEFAPPPDNERSFS